jgi:two-component system nitrogen regulation response regulator GlnG
LQVPCLLDAFGRPWYCGAVSAGSADNRSTLPETPAASESATARPRLALTVLFHPDVGRVGERALLGPSAGTWSAPASRVEPDFAPLLGGPGRPLAEEHLSRKPVVFSRCDDGSVEVDATGTQTKLVLGRKTIERGRLTAAELRRGAVLSFAGHVVLLLHEVAAAPAPIDGEPFGLVGQSDGLRAVLSDILAVADLKKPVLLRGQSGTGKELVARAIHLAGRRNKGPFVAVNLGAVPATIAAAELFGAEKGAFTGAVRRAGYFEQAQGGTLFLDEVGEAAAELQAALLRAIQDSEIQPLGADRPRKVDVRVVAATDADLEAKVQDGSFRAPLLNRLAAYQIWIPPLAERKDDIGRLLARFFEQELVELGGDEGAGAAKGSLYERGWVPAALVAELCEHPLPGNVRQLRNVVHHLVIHGRHQPRVTMTPAVLRLLGSDRPGDSEAKSGGAAVDPVEEARAASRAPLAAPQSSRPPAPSEGGAEAARAPRSGRVSARPTRDLSETEIREALREAHWEIDAAARLLGLARPTLYRAMERFPGIRTARDLRPLEIEQAYQAENGSVSRMAARLEVSEKALSRRVRELGLPEAD